MITIRLQGGLGNTLFQMALASQLKAYGRNVALSTVALGGFRKYELEGYHDLPVLNEETFNSMIIREESFRFDESKLNPPNLCTLIGYWQSPKYFESVAQEVRQKIRGHWYQHRLREAAAGYYEQIWLTGGTNLAIHVRRQDYLRLQNYHGVLPIEYYREAHRFLQQQVRIDKVFVFSDDSEWCHDNFPKNFTIVRGTTAHEDLQLMSSCKHAITANSSFSWWGAFIGDDQLGRVVIAPKQWFTDPTAQSQTQDLIPDNWIKL